MTNNETELTLSQLFKVVAKSWLKIVIYALSAIIIISSVLVTVRGLTGKKTYTATITVSDPEANVTQSLNNRKNTALSNALTNQYGVAADGYLSSLSKKLTVTAVVPTDIDSKTADYIPTKFEISLTEDKSANLSKKEYLNILNGIAKDLVDNYVALNSANVLDTSVSYDVKIKDRINGGENVFRASSKLLISAKSVQHAMDGALYNASDKVKEYRAATTDVNGNQIIQSLAQIYASTSIIIDKIESVQNDLIDYKFVEEYYIDQAIGDAKAALTAEELKLATAKENLEKYVEMRKVTVGGQGTVTLPDTDAGYVRLSAEVMTIQASCASLQKTVDELTLKKNAYSSGTAIPIPAGFTVETVKSDLLSTYDELETIVRQYGDVAKSYNENMTDNEVAKISSDAKKDEIDSAISVTMIILIDLAVFVVAMIVACAQTYDRMKKNNELIGAQTSEE